jgi:hypothetical protein
VGVGVGVGVALGRGCSVTVVPGDSCRAVSGPGEDGQALGEHLDDVQRLRGPGSVFVLTDGADLPPRSWLPTTPAGRFGWAASN